MSAPMRAWRNGHSTPPPTLVEHWKERLARLEAEAATLRAGEERYRQLVESSDDWVWEVDEHWRYTYSSPRCLELLGCRPEQLLRKTPFGLMPADEAVRVKTLLSAHAARRNPFHRLEHSKRARDGRHLILESTGIPVFDARGRFRGYRGVDRDITGHKRAEEALRASEAKFRQVIDASPVPLSVDDMKGTIEYLNQKFVEKFGYAHREVPTSAAWFARAYPNPVYRRQVAEEWNACLQRGLSAGKEIGPLEVAVTCKDGSVRRVEFVGTLLGTRLLIAANDITERKRLERQILEISEQEQERIGQDLHDGLCQLLSGIKFKTTLLEQKLQAKAPAEARDARALENLLNSAIQQARNMARGLHPVDIEARGLMSALEELAGSVASVYGVSCICQFKRPVLVHDHVAARHLYRIAQEAINNAVRHGQARKIWVRLAANEDRLALSVRDNGLGLRAKPKKKAGMGLRLMNYRARTIGATLDVRDRPKGGVIVHCSLRTPTVKNPS
jgi:PAS domain S-box-containing protein